MSGRGWGGQGCWTLNCILLKCAINSSLLYIAIHVCQLFRCQKFNIFLISFLVGFLYKTKLTQKQIVLRTGIFARKNY